MTRDVVDLEALDRTQVDRAGGKGAHLGELSRIDGVHVPPGFCITTDAFQRVVSAALTLDDQLDRLSRLRPDDQPAIDALSAEVRRTIQAVDIPDDLTAAVTSALRPWVTTPPARSGPARPRRTSRRRPSPASTTRTSTSWGRRRSSSTSGAAGRRCSRRGRSAIGCATASTTARSAWPSSSSGWCSRGRRASCSPPIR